MPASIYRPGVIGGDTLTGIGNSKDQTKVDPGLQGRVLAVRNVNAWSALPLAYLAAGPLADQVFEPLLASGGLPTSSIGRLIGVGPGRGIGLLFIVMGILTVLVTIAGYLHPRLRLVEQELPDALAEGAPSHVQQHEPVGHEPRLERISE